MARARCGCCWCRPLGAVLCLGSPGVAPLQSPFSCSSAPAGVLGDSSISGRHNAQLGRPAGPRLRRPLFFWWVALGGGRGAVRVCVRACVEGTPTPSPSLPPASNLGRRGEIPLPIPHPTLRLDPERAASLGHHPGE